MGREQTMTTAPAIAPSDRPWLVQRAGQALQRAAAVILLGLLVARALIGELPFRSSLLNLRNPQAAERDQSSLLARADRGELARVSFSCLLLADVTVWLVGSALAGRLVVRRGKLAALVGLFAVLSLVSVFVASDQRSAMDAWLEQVAMMGGCFLAVQCLGDRRGLRATAVALTAVGTILAAKSVYQIFVEIPQTVAYWKAYGQRSWVAGVAVERAFEARVRATTPTGFFGLSNLLASLLIACLLAAGGLAADKLRRAVSDWQAWRQQRAKWDVHTPTLAGLLTVGLALAVAVALVLTRSRGGIIAAAAALAAWAVLWRWRGALAARWRRAVAVVVGLFLIGWVGVIAYGLAKDRLPSKTMTFRWHYWTGGAGMVADHPWLGVGPGNFASTYLRYRPAGAEETVKMPHNAAVEAVSQYGIPGGLAYLAVVAVVLVGMCRPAKGDSPLAGESTSHGWGMGTLAVALAAAVALSRWLFSDAGADPMLFVLDGFFPAVLLGVLMLAAAWWGGKRLEAQDEGWGGLRVALACGVAGVFLHSMVEFSLFMPGVATAFWVVGGVCLGVAGGSGKEKDLSRLRWVLAADAVVLLIAAVAIFWWPVYHRTMLTELAMRNWVRQDVDATEDIACLASLADPLDGYASADCARAVTAAVIHRGWPWADEELTLAYRSARTAMRRDEAYYGHAALAAEIAWLLANPDDCAYSWDRSPSTAGGEQNFPTRRAIELSQAARRSYVEGHYAQAAEFLRMAVDVDWNSPLLFGYLGDACWLASQADQAAAAWRRAAELAPRRSWVDEALECMARAVELNPQDPRLRLQAAAMYVKAGRVADGLNAIKAAEKIDAALPADSLMRFDADEQREVRMLRARAGNPSAATNPAEKL
jgi:O-antigen ligase